MHMCSLLFMYIQYQYKMVVNGSGQCNLAAFLLGDVPALLGAHWDLSHPPNRKDPPCHLEPGTVASRCGEDL